MSASPESAIPTYETFVSVNNEGMAARGIAFIVDDATNRPLVVLDRRHERQLGLPTFDISGIRQGENLQGFTAHRFDKRFGLCGLYDFEFGAEIEFDKIHPAERQAGEDYDGVVYFPVFAATDDLALDPENTRFRNILRARMPERIEEDLIAARDNASPDFVPFAEDMLTLTKQSSDRLYT